MGLGKFNTHEKNQILYCVILLFSSISGFSFGPRHCDRQRNKRNCLPNGYRKTAGWRAGVDPRSGFGYDFRRWGIPFASLLWFGWMAKVQLLPAVLAVNAGVVAALVLLTLLFGRVYCSVICPLGVFRFSNISRLLFGNLRPS
jgi:hypothetical protein